MVEGDVDFKDGGEAGGHFFGAGEADLSHEAGVAGGGLLEAPHGLAAMERRDPDGESEGGEEDEGREGNDEAAVETSAANWSVIGQFPKYCA